MKSRRHTGTLSTAELLCTSDTNIPSQKTSPKIPPGQKPRQPRSLREIQRSLPSLRTPLRPRKAQSLRPIWPGFRPTRRRRSPPSRRCSRRHALRRYELRRHGRRHAQRRQIFPLLHQRRRWRILQRRPNEHIFRILQTRRRQHGRRRRHLLAICRRLVSLRTRRWYIPRISKRIVWWAAKGADAGGYDGGETVGGDVGGVVSGHA